MTRYSAQSKYDNRYLTRLPGDFQAFAQKFVPVASDMLLIEDSAATNVKKRISVGSIIGGGGGEANTASNIGTHGVGVYDQKLGVDIQFRNIASITNIITVALDAVDNDIDLDVVQGNIVHQNLSGAGTNTHAQIDTHIADTANPHSTSMANIVAGLLANLNTAITDATLDDITGLRTPSLHDTSHENGGADEVDVGGLSGVLADAQNADELLGRDIGAGAPSDGDSYLWVAGSSEWQVGAAVTATAPVKTVGPDVQLDYSGAVKNEVLMYNGTLAVWVAEGTSFTFDISSFSDGQATTIEIGSGIWKAAGLLTFNASYLNGPATAGDVSMTGFGAPTWAPLDMGTPYTGPTVSTSDTYYPAAPGTAYFTLDATDGVAPDSMNDSHNFWTKRFWDVSTIASGITESQVEAFTNSELSNSRTRVFTVNATAGKYIWYCYPNRLGTATFWVSGFSGGFESPETVNLTTPGGFSEDYFCYRSTNSGLGNITVTVT